MIRINQVKINTEHTRQELVQKVAQLLGIAIGSILSMEIVRQSIDARRKPDIMYIYTLDIAVAGEEKLIKRLSGKKALRDRVSLVQPEGYSFPEPGKETQKHRTVIVGTGPAGLFCGYYLALHGYCPILLERGRDVESRQRDVERFFREGILDTASNVQFGEGGAGTFSDGKLNTLVKDKGGRNKEVLRTFVKFGAGEEILYEAKPHIGTDVLSRIVKRMREEIIRLGGSVRFESQMTDVKIQNGRVAGIVINGQEELPCSELVLAIGHSARDTFAMLYDRKLPMEAKAFAVGLRVEHPQEMINQSQYGISRPGKLGAAPYKLTAKTDAGRGVYSFCMCPGGYVVNASSEEGRLAVNGMSYSGRDGKNANSAIIVSVTPRDFGSDHPLAGIDFQRSLEEKAYRLAGGKIPVQRYGDFKMHVNQAQEGKIPEETIQGETIQEGKISEETIQEENVRWGRKQESPLSPQSKGACAWAEVSSILPEECNRAFVEGMEAFGRQIKGFNAPDTILSGVESRTSSPVRIHREESMQAQVGGIYPCGEGAGYAGGITSAAMDGIRTAEAIAALYVPRHASQEGPK